MQEPIHVLKFIELYIPPEINFKKDYYRDRESEKTRINILLKVLSCLCVCVSVCVNDEMALK